MRTIAIIAAGGVGERLGVPGGKQLLVIAGKPVAAWAIQAVADARGVDEIIVACDPDRVADYEEQLQAATTTDKPLRFVAGGMTRTDSIAAALDQVTAAAELILIHDGARPLATAGLVDAAIEALRSAPAEVAGVIVGHPVSDTLKQVGDAKGDGSEFSIKGTHLLEETDKHTGSFERCVPFMENSEPSPLASPLIAATVPREGLWQVQTPQVFRARALRDAYGRANSRGLSATDDAGMLEAAGYELALLTGPRDNIKVTVAEDIPIAEALLRARETNEETRSQ